MRSKHLFAGLFLTCVLGLCSTGAGAQELEPRSLANIPTGMNFLVVGYAHSQGNILLDPAVPIEGLDGNLNILITGYLRSFGLFGTSAKFDIVVPYATGDWKGQVAGVDSSTTRNGFGDSRIRLAVNFIGSPALSAERFAENKARTVAGASLQVIVPTGTYNASRLINLGSNRWTFRTQLGAAHTMDQWTVEAMTGLWIFTDNPDFLGTRRAQHPLWTLKTHIVRSLRSGRWAALDVGYGLGGRATVSGVETITLISTLRFGLTLAWPFDAHHTLKLVATSGVRLEKGPDFDSLGLSYQYRFGGMP